jgi:ABC-2 type transport system ATP-binding protein
VATLIEAQGLTKTYGSMRALDGASFKVEPGRIVGLIGPNGAGKTTALKAILGLTRCDGTLRVCGLDPHAQRAELMQQVSFIADVAVLPRWLKVQNAIDYVAGVHPRFRRDRCEEFLARTNVKKTSRVKELSKGMITQLHLALVMAIDAKLLVLDEPTLGLDILSRKQFYDSLLNDYMDEERTILVTTHQVEEIENILTDVIFIDRGKVVLDLPMDSIPERFAQLLVGPDRAAAARELKPLTERQLLGRHVFLYEGADGEKLEQLGEVRQPSIADLFVAKVHGTELRAAGGAA